MSSNETVSKDACDKEHKRVDEKLNHHENWLGEHEKKIDVLSEKSTENSANIVNLCKQMGGLTKAIWGLVTIAATALVGFFIFVVEKGIK